MTPERKLEIIEKKIERVGEAVGIKNIVKAGDDDEDRKRLKEKLKEALENDHRRRARVISMDKPETWLDYIFGICEPDKRIGKQGSK